MLSNKNILIGITGSIAAYKIGTVLSHLVQKGAHVRVIATPSALQFIGAATIEGLTGQAPLVKDFEPGKMMAHIELARWADIFVVAPATAQTINSLAQGVGHSLLLSTFLAYNFKKPFLVAPAMNPQMLSHPRVQKSLNQLQSWGAKISLGVAGRMACGDVGDGRFIEPEQLIQQIILSLSAQVGPRLLITAGGTRVAIDSVRSITNTSTGKTGCELADQLSQMGFCVDVLLAKTARQQPLSARVVGQFDSFADLEDQLIQNLKNKKYSMIIHAAAVSDFSIDSILQTNQKSSNKKLSTKIESSSPVTLHLRPNKKLLELIHQLAPKSQIVAFKLTDTSSQRKVQASIEKLFKSGAQIVVHNDVSEISSDRHVFHVYTSVDKSVGTLNTTGLSQIIQSHFLKFNDREVFHGAMP